MKTGYSQINRHDSTCPINLFTPVNQIDCAYLFILFSNDRVKKVVRYASTVIDAIVNTNTPVRHSSEMKRDGIHL